jgi:hypothetical protein
VALTWTAHELRRLREQGRPLSRYNGGGEGARRYGERHARTVDYLEEHHVTRRDVREDLAALQEGRR